MTAMMAFFLMMWLLSATTEQQRKGIADYFAPDVPLARISGGGEGLLRGDSPTSHDSQIAGGTAASPGLFGDAAHLADEGGAEAETAALQTLEDMLLGRGGESLLSDGARRHVVTRLTDEGLVIEIFAVPGAPLFDGDTAEPRPVTEEILAAVANVSALVTNPVALGAHLPKRSVV